MITQDELKHFLSYDSDTGVFTWRNPRAFKHKPGALAGTINSQGYRIITIHRRLYGAHRLAWLYVYGALPNGVIDHIDGDRLNNKISNLRTGQVWQNNQNIRGPMPGNTTGYLGVSFEPRSRRWFARIKLRGKKIYLGYYDAPEKAHQAYIKAKREIHEFCTI